MGKDCEKNHRYLLKRNHKGILWKSKGAYFFHSPVDPKKFNIPDYFDIVKKPMDFGTIKVLFLFSPFFSKSFIITSTKVAMTSIVMCCKYLKTVYYIMDHRMR